jgi:hypothetical protein
MKNPYALILLVAATTAYGQINNPPTPSSIGLGATNSPTFSNIQLGVFGSGSSGGFAGRSSGGVFELYGTNLTTAEPAFYGFSGFVNTAFSAGTARTNLGLGAANNVEFRRLKMIAANATDDADNATLWLDASGTNKTAAMRLSGTGGGAEKYNAYLQGGSSGLQVSAANGFRVLSGPTAGVGSVLFAVNSSGNATLNGVNSTAPSQTADSASSLMTRSLSDVRYLGEFWHAWRMSSYNTTNIPVGVFKTAPCVLFTNGQSSFYVEAFLDPSKYAGKTVRVLAYCRVDTTNGGNVQGVGRIRYLTNNAGGPDSNFPLTVGGQGHGTVGVFTNVSTDVFPVATSTNQYLVFTSNVGTISNNATMIIASFGFDRASANTTFTNGNLYMQGVQVVVENP